METKVGDQELAKYLETYQWMASAARSDYDDEFRPQLTAARIVEWEGQQVIVSADGYRIHLQWDVPDSLRQRAFVDNRGLPMIVFPFTSPLAGERRYPSLYPVIKEMDFDAPLTLSCTRFQHAIRQVFDYSEDDLLSSPQVHVARVGQEIAASDTLTRDEICYWTEVDGEGENWAMKFQSKYLLDALEGFHESDIVLRVNAAKTAIAIGEIGARYAVIMAMADRDPLTTA